MSSVLENRMPAEAPAAPTERLQWVDALKGIGILAVVAGHIYPDQISRFLYLFHMPLFFVIGGYLLRPRADLWQFARQKARHLLLPYVCFLAIIYPHQVYLQLTDKSPHTLRLWLHLLVAPLVGGRMLAGPATVFWFVTCFFATQQLVSLLLVRLGPRQVLAVMCAFLALAYVNSLLLPRVWLPWDINVALAAAPLFYAGYLARSRSYRLPTWIVPLLAVFSVVLYYTDYLNVPNMKESDYGTPVLALVFSVAWIALLAALARRMAPIPVLGAGLAALGTASMVIMYVHQSLQVLLQSALGVENPTLRFVGTVTGSWFIFLLLNRWKSTRMLFLGARA